MSVRECQERIDSEEFTYWQAYYNLDPFGNERGDLQAGMMAYTTAASHAGKKGKKLKFEDFVLKFQDDKKRMTDPKQIMNYFKTLGK